MIFPRICGVYPAGQKNKHEKDNYISMFAPLLSVHLPLLLLPACTSIADTSHRHSSGVSNTARQFLSGASIFQQWQLEDLEIGAQNLINFKGKKVFAIKTSWATMLKRSGITRRIRPYDLRHAFATEAIAAGTDIGTVARLMGHSSPNMILQHYQFVMDKQKRVAVEALPEVKYVPQNMCPKK